MKLSVALSRSDNNYDGILIGIALNQWLLLAGLSFLLCWSYWSKSMEDLSIFWYILQFISSNTWSSCHTDLLFPWLVLLKIFYVISSYYKWWCFSDFFLSPFIICILEGYWFFESILYPATLLKVFISCRSYLVEFLRPLIYTIISSANSKGLTSYFPVHIS